MSKLNDSSATHLANISSVYAPNISGSSYVKIVEMRCNLAISHSSWPYLISSFSGRCKFYRLLNRLPRPNQIKSFQMHTRCFRHLNSLLFFFHISLCTSLSKWVWAFIFIIQRKCWCLSGAYIANGFIFTEIISLIISMHEIQLPKII